MAEDRIFRSDDTDAFGQNWLQITATIPSTWTVSYAEIRIGNLPVLVYQSPVFPLSINLSSAQTAQLKDKESIFMALYDSQGRKQTCEGSISFETRSKKV